MAGVMRLLLLCVLFIRGWCQNLVLVGGGLSDNTEEIWNQVIDLAGGQGSARIGIVTAASADPLDSAEYYHEMFQSYGALETYWIPVHLGNTDANSDPEVVDNIQRMTGFFFGGGDQTRIITSFYLDGRQESPALLAIREVFERGAVIGGSSAGAACQNTPVMIAAGMSYEALRYGAYPVGQGGTDYLEYDPDGGIGMLEDYIVDSHFSERGREGRLIRLIADTMDETKGAQLGIGVDEDTAFVITNVGSPSAVGQVIGRAGVYIADLTQAVIDPGDSYFRVLNVFTHYLTHGDQMNMNSREITFDETWKSNLDGDEYYDNAITSDDIFNGNRNSPNQAPEYVRVARSPFDSRFDTSTYGLTDENNPRFVVNMIGDSTSLGYGGYHPVTEEWHISYGSLKVEIESQ